MPCQPVTELFWTTSLVGGKSGMKFFCVLTVSLVVFVKLVDTIRRCMALITAALYFRQEKGLDWILLRCWWRTWNIVLTYYEHLNAISSQHLVEELSSGLLRNTEIYRCGNYFKWHLILFCNRAGIISWHVAFDSVLKFLDAHKSHLEKIFVNQQ